MRAMVLAAGFGTRLQPLTHNRPKCLMPVMNRPLLDIWLKRLAFWGVDRAVVNTHHLAGMVQDWLEHNAPSGLEIRQSHEPEILGTGGGLVAARPLLGQEPFVLVNGDVLAACHVPSLLEILKQNNVLAVLGLVDDPRFNTVAVDEAGQVLGFRGDPGLAESVGWLTYSGLAALTPRLLDFLPGQGYSTLVDGLKAAIAVGEPVLGVKISGSWEDLGTPRAILDLHRRLALKEHADLAEIWPQDSVLVAPDSRLHSEARLQGFAVLGSGSVVEPGAMIIDSVLLPGARVKAGVKVKEAVLGDNFVAKEDIAGGAHGD